MEHAHPLAFISKHKVAFGIGAAALLVFLFVRNYVGAGSASTTTTQTDPNADALAAQQQAISASAAQAAAQYAAQQDAEQFQLAYLHEQGTVSTQQQANAITGQLQLAGIQANSVNLQTVGQTQLGLAETAAQIQMSQIMANENVAINQANNQTQQVISTNQSNVGIAQTQAATAIAGETGGNSMSSIIGSVGSLAAVAAAFI